MRRRIKVASVLGAAALVGSSLGASAYASGPQQTARAGSVQQQAPRLDHIFVIMLENHSQSSIIGDKNAPFINRLASNNAMATHYYGVTHPSMPNYIAAIAGSSFGIQDDHDQNIVHLRKRNLVDQLEHHGVRWGAYMEDLPKDKLASFGPANPSDPSKPYALYAKKHNAFVLFDDVKNRPARMRHVKDYSRLGHDLDSAHAPRFVWISPNQCHDMHGGVTDHVAGHPETPCPYGGAKDDANDAALKQKADAFVRRAVHTIRGSQAWTRHSAIVIVTDENDYTGNRETGGWESADGCCASPYIPKGDARVSSAWPGGTYGGGLIPAIIVSPAGRHHFVDHRKYNHYSLLRTVEENWHMARLRNAGDTVDGVRSMWHSFVR